MSSVSILMCSYNGDDLLNKSVNAIIDLDVQLFDFVEFVFVDNDSKNDLQQVIHSIWSQRSSTIKLKTISETKKGKTAAFLTGFNLCEGEFVVVCDDDNVLFKNYLIEGFSYLKTNSKIGVLGGCGIPVSDVELPNWLSQYLADFACGEQAVHSGNIFPGRNVVYGAGMWFRARALRKALDLGFNFMFDYVKDNPQLKNMSNGGEDGELCWAIRYQNYEIHYLNTLKFYHFIDQQKFSYEYLELLKSRKSKYTLLGQVYRRALTMNVNSVKNYWFKEVLYIFVNYLKNFRFSKNYIINETKRNFSNLIFLFSYRTKYDSIINSLLKYKSNFIE